MSREESLLLLDARWPELENAVRRYGGDPAIDLVRDELVVHLRILARARTADGGRSVRDVYWFRLDFADYDEHAPRIYVCDPQDRSRMGTGRQFYPLMTGNGTFGHDGFLCMPGDRRCYDSGNHPEWKVRGHYHPDVVAEYLFELLTSHQYQGRA